MEAPAQLKKSLTLKGAKDKLHVGKLCCDKGDGVVQNSYTLDGNLVVHPIVCPGVTSKILRKTLSNDHQKSIRDAIDKAASLLRKEEIELTGFTGDTPAWMFQRTSVADVAEKPVFLSSVIMLPMIQACFKSFESVLVITPCENQFAQMVAVSDKFGIVEGAFDWSGDDGTWNRFSATECDQIAAAEAADTVARINLPGGKGGKKIEYYIFTESGEARPCEGLGNQENAYPRRVRKTPVVDTSRVFFLPLPACCDAETLAGFDPNAQRSERQLSAGASAQNQDLLNQIAKTVTEKVRQHNSSCIKDGFIKAIVLDGDLSVISAELREACKMPVFDESSLIGYFTSAMRKSYWNESSQVRRKDRKKKVGVIRLDYHYPTAIGDSADPDSFGYEVVTAVIPGLLFDKAQAGDMSPEILKNLAAGIRKLEEQEVIGITGDCGFMMHYQCFARFVAQTPCFMSALLQASTLSLGVAENQRVLILTANSETLSPFKDQLLRNAGIAVSRGDKFLIHGFQDLGGFDAVAKAEAVDYEKVVGNMIPAVLKIMEEQAKAGTAIGSILLECTELPQFCDELRKATRIPIVDSITVVNFFLLGTPPGLWSTQTFAPHNPDFWVKNFSQYKDGGAVQEISAVPTSWSCC